MVDIGEFGILYFAKACFAILVLSDGKGYAQNITWVQ